MIPNGADENGASRRDRLARLIADRLDSEKDNLQQQMSATSADVGARHCILDNMLPDAIANEINAAFPPVGEMRLMSSFRERKYTSKNLDKFDPLMADITFAVQAPTVLALVQQITGIKNQFPDALLYAGGLSTMAQGHFLAPHIDNSHDSSGKYYRTLNLLYYVTPNWSLDLGGNLELWDRAVRRNKTIVSEFNRLVIMETTPASWHSVSSVTVNRLRCCVSNYYFSPDSPTGIEYRNVTSFSARPEQKVRRAIAWVDNRIREVVRVVAPSGVGKKDLYQGPRQ
jgi:Rps23 Pro-64 3,4-dihydroxylase Tpa1-like proline 4-hydroxylase